MKRAATVTDIVHDRPVSHVAQRASTFALVSIVASILLGLMLVWNRGLYMDDYITKWAGQDIATGTWKLSLTPLAPYARIVGQLVQQNTAPALPTYEFPARLIWACVHLASVLMLGLIIYQATESQLAAVIAMWLFSTPYIAHEAILWFTQVGQHGIGTLLFLVALYLMIRVVKAPHIRLVFVIAACICIALGLQFSEMPLPVVGYVPLLTGVMVASPQQRLHWRRKTVLAIGFTLLGLGIAWLHYKLFLSKYLYEYNGRGEVRFSIVSVLQKFVTFLYSFYEALFSPSWGVPLTKALFALGVHQIVTNPVGIVLGLLLGGSTIAYIITVPLPVHNRWTTVLMAGLLSGAGCIWVLGALTPGTLIAEQLLQGRMLYIAMAGVAVAVAGVVWALVALLPPHLSLFRRALLLIPAGMMLFSTIVMVGFCEMYKLRGQADERQIQAVLDAIHPEQVPSNALFIPISPDFTITRQLGVQSEIVDKALLGVFEVEWSCDPAVRMMYHRNDVECVATNHWLPGLHFAALPAHDSTPSMLHVEGYEVAADKALAFTYRNDHVVLLSPLVVTATDGKVLETITLPLVEAYKAQGVPVEAAQVAPITP